MKCHWNQLRNQLILTTVGQKEVGVETRVSGKATVRQGTVERQGGRLVWEKTDEFGWQIVESKALKKPTKETKEEEDR